MRDSPRVGSWVKIDFGSAVDPAHGGTYRLACVFVLARPVVLTENKATAAWQLLRAHYGYIPNLFGLVDQTSKVAAHRAGGLGTKIGNDTTENRNQEIETEYEI